MARIFPWISIALGLFLTAPFVVVSIEEYFSSPDRSVGAMFIPLVFFALSISAAIGAFLFFWGVYSLKPGVRRTLLIIMLVSTTSIGGLTYFSWSQANIKYVAESAEKIAGDAPYCIDVPAASGMEEAGALADFSGYLRQSPRGWGGYAGPRPILAVGDGVQPEVYHWSFYQKSFIKDDGRLTPVYCRPRRNFVLTMSHQQRVEQRANRIRYAGMYLAIPPAYRGGIADQSTPTISFYATAPLFESAPDTRQPDSIYSHIEVNFADTRRADVWLTKDSRAYVVQDRDARYGLRSHALWHVRSGQRDRSGTPSFQYFDISPDKRVATLIACPPDDAQGFCLHVFRRGGWTYTFYHRPADLPNWRSMQKRLVELTQSFVKSSIPVAMPTANLKAVQSGGRVGATKPAPPRGPKVVKTFRDCADCPEMVEITAGSFDMGSRDHANLNAKPVHRVVIANAFAIGKTELTQAQWRAVMGSNPSFFKRCGDNCPVENVTWRDVQTFIKKLNSKTGKHYRLPSEAEWEYACRAGGEQDYCGSDDINSVAWYQGNSDNTTHPVAAKQPNKLGLYDMSGNVYEWVADIYHNDYVGAPVDGSVWDPDGAYYVTRGGSWMVGGGSWNAMLNASSRKNSYSGIPSHDIGFRVVRTLP